MKKYNVHFMGYYSYDMEIEAENRDEAYKKAEEIEADGDIPLEDYDYVSNGFDVLEVE